MGPRTYIRGNEEKSTRHSAGQSWLQWGRGLTSAEIDQACDDLDVEKCGFNGAADLHPRK